jgi:hypothetical protein
MSKASLALLALWKSINLRLGHQLLRYRRLCWADLDYAALSSGAPSKVVDAHAVNAGRALKYGALSCCPEEQF